MAMQDPPTHAADEDGIREVVKGGEGRLIVVKVVAARIIPVNDE